MKRIIDMAKKAEVKEPVKRQHLFRVDRVEDKKKEGWELVKIQIDKATHTEMALMER
jgi:hypothetical protein